MLAPNDPRGYVVGVVSGVPFVIERELFDCTVAGAKVVKFMIKIPLAATAGARNSWDTGVVG